MPGRNKRLIAATVTKTGRGQLRPRSQIAVLIKEARFVDTDLFYSESNMKALLESVQQAKEGKIIVKTMGELEQIAGEDFTIHTTYDNRTE